MNKNRFRVILAVLSVVLAVTWLAINYIFDPFIEQVQRYPSYLGTETGFYQIDPTTILEALDNGDINVFRSELSRPEAPISSKRFSWKQDDYTRIILALNRFVWNDTLDDWKVYTLQFDTECDQNPTGFEFAHFYYYKTIFIRGHAVYAGRGFEVNPKYGYVEWGSGPNYPHPLPGWKNVKQSEFEITAEEALKLAEENGGRLVRLSVQNKCSIGVNIFGGTGWQIYMNDDEVGWLFQAEINPFTGVMKLHP